MCAARDVAHDGSVVVLKKDVIDEKIMKTVIELEKKTHFNMKALIIKNTPLPEWTLSLHEMCVVLHIECDGYLRLNKLVNL